MKKDGDRPVKQLLCLLHAPLSSAQGRFEVQVHGTFNRLAGAALEVIVRDLECLFGPLEVRCEAPKICLVRPGARLHVLDQLFLVIGGIEVRPYMDGQVDQILGLSAADTTALPASLQEQFVKSPCLEARRVRQKELALFLTMKEKIGQEPWCICPLLVQRAGVLEILPLAPLDGRSIVERVSRAAADGRGQSENSGAGHCAGGVGEVRAPRQMIPQSPQPGPAIRTAGEVTEERMLLAGKQG